MSRLLLRLIVRGALGLAAIDAILFGLARRLDWGAAWAFTALLGVYLAAGVMWFVRRDTELLSERMANASNGPQWDRVLGRVYGVLLLPRFARAAVDTGRVQCSRVPMGVQSLAGVGMLAALGVIWWCTAANHYLSSQVRIQTERGHRVVQGGPYRFIRHPMYTSLIVLTCSMALLLGSWLAVVPALAIGSLLVVRTLLEDQMLRDQLPGYGDYANQVTRRLLPGVW